MKHLAVAREPVRRSRRRAQPHCIHVEVVNSHPVTGEDGAGRRLVGIVGRLLLSLSNRAIGGIEAPADICACER